MKSMRIYSEYYLKKFKDHTFDSEGNLNESNIILGETLDWLDKKESDFPRLEFFIASKTGAGEVDNVSQDDHLTLGLSVYTWHDGREFSQDNYFEMLDLMDEVEEVVKSISADRAQGNQPSPDFLRLSSYSSMEVEPDFGENIACGLMTFNIVLTKELY